MKEDKILSDQGGKYTVPNKGADAEEIQDEKDYWKVYVDGEEWIVFASSVKEVIKLVLEEEDDAYIESLERTNIQRVI